MAIDYIAVPPEVLKDHEELTVPVKLIYVNKLKFVVSTSQGISSMTAEYINNIYNSMIMASIKKVFNLYYKYVFKVNTLILEP